MKGCRIRNQPSYFFRGFSFSFGAKRRNNRLFFFRKKTSRPLDLPGSDRSLHAKTYRVFQGSSLSASSRTKPGGRIFFQERKPSGRSSLSPHEFEGRDSAKIREVYPPTGGSPDIFPNMESISGNRKRASYFAQHGPKLREINNEIFECNPILHNDPILLFK